MAEQAELVASPASTAPLLGVELVARFEARLRRQDYSPLTTANYTYIARKLLAAYPSVAPQYLSAEHITQFLDAQARSPRSYYTKVVQLKAFFHYLRRYERLIRSNPCDDVEKPRYRIRYRPAPTREEFDRMRLACRTPDEILLIEFLYFTGLRVSELRALRWKHMDLPRRRAYVEHGKGDKERVVIFPPHVAQMLAARQGPPDYYVFPSAWHSEGPRALTVIQTAVRRIGQRAGLRYGLTPHVLRHGFARLCKTSSVPIEFTARLMGHVDTRPTVAIYGRLDAQDLQTVYDRLITEDTEGGESDARAADRHGEGAHQPEGLDGRQGGGGSSGHHGA